MSVKTPLEATPERLAKFLERRPVLWVGAGASVAAGYPSTGRLISAMVEAAGEPIDPALPFFQVADRFLEHQTEGELSVLLQRELGPPRPPTSLHRAIARFAKAGSFRAIVTTNYDNLLERALDEAGVPYVLQPLDQNAAVEVEEHVRLLKLHGSREGWLDVVLSGRSYEKFGQTYSSLLEQLNALLTQHPILFVGCSLQDPRLLDWLAKLPPEAGRNLKSWRTLMTRKEWDDAVAATWDGKPAADALARGGVTAFLLRDHAHLGELWGAVADEIRPDTGRLEIEVEVGDRWRARMAGCPDWEPLNPLDDPSLAADLKTFSEVSYRSLPTNEKGDLSPEAASDSSALRILAASIGERLTSALLSSDAQERLIAAIHAGTAGTPPLLLLQIRPAVSSMEAEHRADQALALPWELLRLEDRFPVEEGTLDLAREAVVKDMLGLPPPDRLLSIVATVASPIDASPFDYEEEMYRLWRAVGEQKQEKRLLVTDLGTLDDLVRTVERHKPPVIHFTGHGRPGALAFEDEEAGSDLVEVKELIRQLRDAGLPRLIFLSACHGTTAGSSPSTAASLHRAGFPQVAAYLGPVHDRQATRTAAAFYAALARGRTAWEALRKARLVAMEPLRDGGGATHVYPLGWSQLVLYHRGKERLTVLPAASGGPVVDLPGKERERRFDRLDRAGGSQRVEGIAGVQRLRFGFIGRRHERAKAIRKWRQGQRQLVVQGLGGLGKTALCTELAPLLAEIVKPEGACTLALDGRHAGAQEDPILALWQEVQGARSDSNWGQILAELQKDGVTGEALARAVLALQEIEGGVLVYLDDAESLQVPLGQGGLGRWRNEEVARFWKILVDAAVEEGSLGLLVSSRYQPAGTPSEAVLPLPEMHRFEIVRLLSWMKTLGRMPAADRDGVADRVSGHPRTIEYLEALAKIRETDITPPGESYAGERWKEDILDPALSETQEKVDADLLLGKVWDALSPAVQEHLGRCSVLTAPAPWEAIRTLETEQGTGRRLVEVGLLSPFEALVGDNAWWAPHRLVTEEAQKRWSGDPQKAHRQLGEWFESQFRETSASAWAVRAVDHLLKAGEADLAWPTARLLVIDLRTAGRYREALSWVERVLAVGPTGPQLGLAWTFQVHLQRRAGVLELEARNLLERALGLVEAENQSFVLNELGKLCSYQGHLREAADYLERSVAVETTIKGEEQPNVAALLHSLAGVLKAQGDLAGARERLEKSLSIKARVFGTEEHPDVAASLHELAGVLQAQGDLAGARERLEKSLSIKARVFGTEEHPSVAASLHSLAGVLQAQGDLAGARERLERVLEIEEKIYRTREHYSTAITEMVLGFLLFEQGELQAAAERLVHAYSVFLRDLGPNHPHTRRLAPLFEKRGEEAAEEPGESESSG